MATFECPVCFEDVPLSETHVCPNGHRTCLDCYRENVMRAMKDHARIGCTAVGCDWSMAPSELRAFLQLLISKNKWSGDPAAVEAEYDQRLLEASMATIPGIVHCPTTNCENWLILDDPSVQQGCTCGGCGATFCGKCKAVPYHYHCACGEEESYRAKWVAWESGGRVKYNSDRKDALQQLESQRAAIEERNAAARRHYEELLATEKHFSEIVRYCPKCGRPIEKVAGCDSMVCGRNFHGGDVQDGCGASFDWASARPYVPEHIAEPKRELLLLEIPPIAKTVIHRGVICDACHKEIRGLRFACIHCPCCNFCQDCEAESVSHHPKDHIFRIIDKPGIL